MAKRKHAKREVSLVTKELLDVLEQQSLLALEELKAIGNEVALLALADETCVEKLKRLASEQPTANEKAVLVFSDEKALLCLESELEPTASIEADEIIGKQTAFSEADEIIGEQTAFSEADELVERLGLEILASKPKPKARRTMTEPEKTLKTGTDPWDDCSMPDIEGWFKADLGAKIKAKILHLIVIKDKKGKKRQAAVCQLLDDCAFATYEKKPIELKEGQIIGVGINFMLKPILAYAANQGEFRAKLEEKKELPGGNTVWKGKLQCRGVKAAPPVPIIGGGGSTEGPVDDGDLGDDDLF